MIEAGAGHAAPDGRRLVVLIGAVGAGKGTQAEMLGRELGLVHLASGNLFRAALREGTPLGEQARQYMERGDLVPDDTTIAMFMDELAKPEAARGAILDGFPRTAAQAQALDATLAEKGERIGHAVYIDVPADELVERVSGRWVCPECGTPYHLRSDPPARTGICDKDGTRLLQRDDDRPEVVRARLEKQVPPMLEVVEHYRQAGVLERVDGTGSIDEVADAIREVLG
ncbi:MAG TPA: adenylate kinase [Candidatus Limnocylindria bacterium]